MEPVGQVSLRGVVVDDALGWGLRRGAEVVDFAAPRGPRMTPRSWLGTVAAIDGRARRDADALVDAILRRAGLSVLANAPLSGLPPFARAALAVAEVAVAIAGAPSEHEVVVPEPPLPWPHRHELRRLAADLLAGARVILHARDAAELSQLVERDAILEGAAGVPHAGRSILVRVYGWGEPYEAFKRALEERGVTIGGGPIAHVLGAPDGFGPREVLAAAYEAGLDVLEVREAFTG
ncbi:MAG: hypothetical protein HYV09_28120 [Deltaproteobacteria bacterium]|nr:hypothetical protein [Deltaproteobacteria bacterium]